MVMTAVERKWIETIKVGSVELEGVTRFDYQHRTFAIYRSADDQYFATDGLCTHERVHLADGFVVDPIIECAQHGAQFNYRTGKVVRAPACKSLKTYPVKIVSGMVMIGLD